MNTFATNFRTGSPTSANNGLKILPVQSTCTLSRLTPSCSRRRPRCLTADHVQRAVWLSCGCLCRNHYCQREASLGGWPCSRSSCWAASQFGSRLSTWFRPHHADAFQPRGPTVAVLAFDNLSGDPGQEAFVDGFGDELITALSKFGLRVIARNTTFTYKGKAVDIMELGRRLQAQYVVEGSFRRNQDRISINVQLIDARIGTHVWAQSYERSTSSASLEAIQDEIA